MGGDLVPVEPRSRRDRSTCVVVSVLLRIRGMTAPRFVAPGMTVMLTRRTERQHYLFTPGRDINQLFLYTLAVSAQRHAIEVHCATLMSTHEHIVLTDTLGRLPSFTAELHRIMALGTKVLRHWDGSVWDGKPPSVVHLLTPQSVIEKCGYVMANPVAALAVEHAREWPGVWFGAPDVGRRVVRVHRPHFFFDDANEQWPDEVELVLTIPPALRELYGDDQARAVLGAEQLRQEQLARDEAKRLGVRFMGRRKVLMCSPFQRARRAEPLFDRNPTLAVGRGNKAEFFAAVQWLREFRSAYRKAFELWRAGLREVLFPFGTWCMKQLHAVTVARSASET